MANTMGSIRVGLFDDVMGADTLLRLQNRWPFLNGAAKSSMIV